MAGSEKRHPRAFFTKKLIRMCQRLDQASTHDVPSFNPFIRKSETIQVSVEKLWVVGSYARGALDCGDLDILLKGVVSRATARSSSITRVFFKSPAYVRSITAPLKSIPRMSAFLMLSASGLGLDVIGAALLSR